MSELPEGWAKATLKDCLQQKKGKVDPARFPDWPYLGMDDIEADTGIILSNSLGVDFKSQCARYKEGDLLYGRLRPYLNKVARAPFKGLASAELLVYESSGAIELDYALSVLRSAEFLEHANRESTGDRPRLSPDSLGAFELPLPPLAEQKRIVEKLNSLTAESRTAAAALARTEALIVRYKAAILEKAFQGTLTLRWRAEAENSPTGEDVVNAAEPNRISVRRSKLPSRRIVPEFSMPKGWVWARLEDVCSDIVDGTHHTPEYTSEGVPFLSVKDIKGGKLYFDNCKYVSVETHEELSRRCSPQRNDLLITKSGTIGRCALVDTDTQFSLFVSVALIRTATQLFNPAYLKYALEHWVNTLDIASDITGTTIKNLHLQDMKALEVPIPPPKEQEEIVARIEAAFEQIDTRGEAISAARARIINLDSAVLAKAFRGDLVPQDPNDEPASELLKRAKEIAI